MPEGSSTTGNPLTDLLVVAVLILTSSFFAASEIALITVKRHRLTQLAADDADLVPIVVVLRDFARSLDRVARPDADQASLVWRFIQSRLDARHVGARGAKRLSRPS